MWMMGTNGVIDKFKQASSHADVAVIEGVMGLFDGVSGKFDFGSTAHTAKILNAPIILVIDAGKSGGSIAALVYGFLNFDKKLKIAGIVLNNVASVKHLDIIKEAMEGRINVPIVGVIGRNNVLALKERHLGLIPVPETRRLENKILRTSQLIAENISFNDLKNPIMKNFIMNKKIAAVQSPQVKCSVPSVRIAIAKDESFNFYYADNIESLKINNAEIVYFSPVNDKKLPEGISGIILGGGFPEILADKLEKNHNIKRFYSASSRARNAHLCRMWGADVPYQNHYCIS